MKPAIAVLIAAIAVVLIPISIASVLFIAGVCTIAPAVGQAASNTADALQATANLLEAPKDLAKGVSNAFAEAKREADQEREAKEKVEADSEHVVIRDGYMAWDDFGHHFEIKDTSENTELYVDGKFEARFPLGGHDAVIYADHKYNPAQQSGH
jgi:hypothetical protein